MVNRFAALVLALTACLASFLPATRAMAEPGRETMRTLRSDSELRALLRRTKTQRERMQAGSPPQPPPPPPAPLPPAAPAAEGATSITNNQTAGVDEGGIVKQHGRHLVVLRRGRLFTIDTGDGSLTKIDQADAFPPSDRRAAQAWYDELLIAGDTIAVIGFNYARAGTEINRFRIDERGRLTYIDTHQLRSNDYFSAENYASRLIGSKLVIYTPLYADPNRPLDSLPGLRRWSEGGPNAGFERLAIARNIHVPGLLLNAPKANLSAYHSVTSCDLATRRLDCTSTVVLGSWGRTFYVGTDAVYVWTGNLFQRSWDDRSRADPRGLVYRIPLDGAAPQAAVVWGGPVDQFSFRSEPDGSLHVLVRSGYGGDAMWLSEWESRGAIALLTLPPRAFGRGNGMPNRRDYRPLPGGEAISGLENRFIGSHLVYAGSSYNGRQVEGRWKSYDGPMLAYAVALDGDRITSLEPGSTVTRIDRMGNDAILIGQANGALRFQSAALERDGPPRIVDRYDMPAAREGESRSQAFFYRSDSRDGRDGVLGLPVVRMASPGEVNAAGRGAGMFYMRRRDRRLHPAGQLDSAPVASVSDGCKASCVDWYGNARPIFLGERILALMGYELVEGRLRDGEVVERGRLDFGPGRVAD